MFNIITKEYNKDEVMASFLNYLSEMVLMGMGSFSDDDATIIEQAEACIEDAMPFEYTNNGIIMGSDEDSVEDWAFDIAMDLFGENNFDAEFGDCEESTLGYAAKQLLEEFPGIEFTGSLYLDTQWSNTIERVKTVNGEIVSEIIDEDCDEEWEE